MLISKMDVKMNLWILTKNHAADSKKGTPKNRFKSLWNSRVYPDSLGVKYENLIIAISRKKVSNISLRFGFLEVFSKMKIILAF